MGVSRPVGIKAALLSRLWTLGTGFCRMNRFLVGASGMISLGARIGFAYRPCFQ